MYIHTCIHMCFAHTSISNSITMWENDVQLERRQGFDPARPDSTWQNIYWPTRLPAICRRSLHWPYKKMRFFFIWWNEIQFLKHQHAEAQKKSLAAIAIAIFLAHNALFRCPLPAYWRFYKSIFLWITVVTGQRDCLLIWATKKLWSYIFKVFVWRINLFARCVYKHEYHESLLSLWHCCYSN